MKPKVMQVWRTLQITNPIPERLIDHEMAPGPFLDVSSTSWEFKSNVFVASTGPTSFTIIYQKPSFCRFLLKNPIQNLWGTYKYHGFGSQWHGCLEVTRSQLACSAWMSYYCRKSDSEDPTYICVYIYV